MSSLKFAVPIAPKTGANTLMKIKEPPQIAESKMSRNMFFEFMVGLQSIFWYNLYINDI